MDGKDIVLANPYKTRTIAEAQVKTDKVDAFILAQLTDREAAQKLLCAIPGVQRGSDLPTAGKEKPSSPAVEVDPATRAKLLARVADFYAKTLHRCQSGSDDRAGLDYLKTRRLDDPAMLETFQAGYCNGTLRNALPKAGEIIGQLQAIGILNEKGNECFYGRVIVPILECGPHGQMKKRLEKRESRSRRKGSRCPWRAVVTGYARLRNPPPPASRPR
jgi:hypothetical protein